MSRAVLAPTRVGAVVASAGRVGSFDSINADLHRLDQPNDGVVDVVVFERRPARWAPVFSGRFVLPRRRIAETTPSATRAVLAP